MDWIVNSCVIWDRSNFISFLNTFDLKLAFKDGFQSFSYSLFVLLTRITNYSKTHVFLKYDKFLSEYNISLDLKVVSNSEDFEK